MRALTTTDVARRPYPGTTVPGSVRFSPSGEWLTFLLAEPGSLEQELIAVHTASGERYVLPTPGQALDEAELDLEERLRRERARELAVGVTRYAWAADADRMLVPMSDGLWVLDGIEAALARAGRRVVAASDLPGPPLDARISADGTRLLFIADAEVHVAGVDDGTLVQVTTGARGTGRTNGLAEYVAQEEMGRAYGCWLSPDGQRVAFCEVDDTHIPDYRIVHQGSDGVGVGAQEDHRYPFAGAANAHVRVGVVAADGSTADGPVWLDLGCTGIDDDRYVARVDWIGPDALVVQVQDRSQQRLDLIRFDLDGEQATGRLLHTERSEVWIDLHDLCRFRADGSFVWATSRTDHRHLVLHDADGTEVRALTAGEWEVVDVIGGDDDHLWCTTTEGSPLERRIERVSIADGSMATVVTGPGTHTGVVHAATGRWLHTWSSPDAPPVARLRNDARSDLPELPGAGRLVHDASSDPRVAELDLRPPTFHVLTAADGTTELHSARYLPDGDGPFPLVVWCYGGPHAQLVARSWTMTVAMRAQLLAQRGIAVAVVDNRGMAHRGLAFEGALRHRMGTVEVDDQVRLVESLVAEGIVDPGRVGIYGWSYGGYLSAMCLARRPDVFRAACAGAPVTHWDGYDTHYTERYMGTPTQNPDGYRDGSVMAHIEGFRDRELLLVHGLIDENVHFRHTARLIDALVRADIDHRLLLYPNERHLPRLEADRASMERKIVEFFADALT